MRVGKLALAAGVAVGPYALNLLHQEEGVFHIAEFGVVLFLFVIGLELSVPRLWALRRDIFGLGAAQIALTGAAIAAIFIAVKVMPTAAAAIAGLSLAFSSTAFALQYMKDRGELNTDYGARAFPVLLMQDLAVAPLLAAIPFAASAGAGAQEIDMAQGWPDAFRVGLVIGAIVAAARFANAFQTPSSSPSRMTDCMKSTSSRSGPTSLCARRWNRAFSSRARRLSR